jgi:hypothetical protein
MKAVSSTLPSKQYGKSPTVVLLRVPGRSIVLQQDEQLFEYSSGRKRVLSLHCA